MLSRVDVLALCEVYPAGEAPIAGADGRALSRAVRARGLVDPVFVPEIEDLNETLSHLVRGGDIVVSMGAGDQAAIRRVLIDFLCGQAEQPGLDLRTNGG